MPINNSDRPKKQEGNSGAGTNSNSGSSGKAQQSKSNSKNLLVIISAVAAVVVAGGVIAAVILASKAPEPALAINGISCDKNEHVVYHTHTHLDIFVNGQPFEVPGGVGIKPSECLFWMHTHSADGIIHVESPKERQMTLGEFFDIWARTVQEVPQFPAIPSAGNSSPVVYVNGEKASGNYRDTTISPDTEIALVYGSPAPTTIPSSYAFGKTDIKLSSDAASVLQKIVAPPTAGSGPLGDKNAPITIVEFGDYQCNSCGIFHKETKDAVISNLVNTGKANFLFKDFTLNDNILQPRQGSTLAAEAAYCAGDQGKFWEYHDELYNNQKPEGVVWVSEAGLKGFATNVGISDLQAFSQCLDSHQHRTTVNSNNDLVRQLGLGATPTFIVISMPDENGISKNPVKLVGAHPYASFEAVVNQLLPSESN